MTTEQANRFPMSAWIAVLLIAMLFTTGTAWAGLTFTVVTEPAEAGEGGSYEMRKISEDVYSDRQFIVIPEEGFTVKSVIWTDKDRIPETLTEISMVGEGGTIESYYTAPNASGEVVITFEMKKKDAARQAPTKSTGPSAITKKDSSISPINPAEARWQTTKDMRIRTGGSTTNP